LKLQPNGLLDTRRTLLPELALAVVVASVVAGNLPIVQAVVAVNSHNVLVIKLKLVLCMVSGLRSGAGIEAGLAYRPWRPLLCANEEEKKRARGRINTQAAARSKKYAICRI
jgi:hypothetical protein